jgi:Ca2+-transporting ATPase
MKPVVRAEAASVPWHSLEPEQVLARLQTQDKGLARAEAAMRRTRDGPNALATAQTTSLWRTLLNQFRSLIIWILIAAGVLSALIGDAIDAWAIFAIVLLNALIGFYQEFSAQRSINALQKLVAPQAQVRRDNSVRTVPAADLVVGDILVLAAGDLVGADARLLQATALTCVESALTGESLPVTKTVTTLPATAVALGDRSNMLFMATSVVTGTGEAVVVATATRSELGAIAGLIDDAGHSSGTPLEQRLEAFGRALVWAALAIVAAVTALGYLRGTGLTELLMTAVGLAVAAVPEGLPAVVTVALSLGVLRMARRNTLVRKLAAVETLGSTTVICSDKTGTLTVGEMTARALHVAGHNYTVTGEGYAPAGEVQFAGQAANGEHQSPLLDLASVLVACNAARIEQVDGAWRSIGDPTEAALLVAGRKAGADDARIAREMPVLQTLPFDSARKRSTVIRRLADGTVRAFCNGAPGDVLAQCSHIRSATGIRMITPQDREQLLAATSTMAQHALRVLASAWRDLDAATAATQDAAQIEREMVFIGLTGMHDPPRAEARAALATCRAAGIRVVMITGDHAETATAIARDIGIAGAADVAVSGNELDQIADAELQQRVAAISVYARVTAAHKLRIIRAWQANDAVVAMTGDGVNDAPAIKGADIGIAMGKAGTEVTKQAADMIIVDDNFATIVAAVEQGRGIYANIRKTLQYLLAGNTAELLLVAVCVLIGLPMPLLPIHLLWINLVTDGLPALCLAIDPIDTRLMTQPPRARKERLTDRGFLRTLFFTGALTAGVALAVFVFMLQVASADAARTYAFTTLVFAELLRAFGARSETQPVWRLSLLGNPALVIVVVGSIVLQLALAHIEVFARFLKMTPLPLADAAILFGLAMVPSLLLEIAKWIRSAQPRIVVPTT